MIHHYKNKFPNIHPSAFIAKNATIIGDVTIEEEVSIWFQTVIRGDVAPTYIGKRVNIQDLSLIHQSPNLPVTIKNDVTVGHQVTVHGCTIQNMALIGMGSILLDGVEIGENAFIGAGSLLSPNTKIPPFTLAFGRPAKVIRELSEEDIAEMERIKLSYLDKREYYLKHTDLNMDI